MFLQKYSAYPDSSLATKFKIYQHTTWLFDESYTDLLPVNTSATSSESVSSIPSLDVEASSDSQVSDRRGGVLIGLDIYLKAFFFQGWARFFWGR